MVWLADQTRPDIANTEKAVARYTDRPREVHWRTAVGIFEFGFSTSEFDHTFQKGSGLELVAFADANYTNKATDWTPVYGRAILCAGACVLVSRTQKFVTLSTTEAGYVALADPIKDAMFLRYVWYFIFPGFAERCSTIFEDTEGARPLAQNIKAQG